MSNAAATQRTDAQSVVATGGATEVSLQALIAALVARLGILGQTDMAGSTPVVIASDQTALQTRAADSPDLDAFSRQRVSSPIALCEFSFEYDLNPLYFEQIVSGGATITHDANKRSAILTLSTGADTAGTGTVEIPTATNPRTATFSVAQTFAAGDVFQVGSTIYQVTAPVVASLTASVNGETTKPAGSAFTIWGSHAILRQRGRNLYEKGKSQLIKVTFLFGAAVEGITRQAGYYSQNNGYLFRQERAGGVTTVSFVERTSTTGTRVENVVPQASWNLDPLDGTGPSGITLDLQYQEIAVIDAQFLGAGRVRAGFDIDGCIIYVHEFLHANRAAIAPYMQTFTLNMTWEAYNNSVSAGATQQCICCEVESEGGTVTPPNPYHFSQFNAADVAITTSMVHLMSLRPKATFGSRVNRMIILPKDLAVLVGTNAVIIHVMYGAALAGGAWVSAGANSGVEVNTGGAAVTITGGELVDCAPGPAGGDGGNRNSAGVPITNGVFPIVLDTFGANPQALTLAAQTVTGAANCRGIMTWHELR